MYAFHPISIEADICMYLHKCMVSTVHYDIRHPIVAHLRNITPPSGPSLGIRLPV